MDFKQITIDSIGLSRRSNNALKRAGVNNVGEMLQYTEEGLYEIRNLGVKSINEILEKIEEYKAYDREGRIPDQEILSVSTPDDFDAWCDSEEGQRFIQSWLHDNKVKTSALDILSPKAYNTLLLNHYTQLEQIVFMSEEQLISIPRMDPLSATETVKMCRLFLTENQEEIIHCIKTKLEKAAQLRDTSIRYLIQNKENHDSVFCFVKANDYDFDALGFSNRAKNQLTKNGYSKLSDLIFLTPQETQQIPGLGAKTVDEIQSVLSDYLTEHEQRIRAMIDGDDSVLWTDDAIRNMILETYNQIGFKGLSFQDFRQIVKVPEQVTDDHLKKIIGEMLADGTLEYVDYRCYRVYTSFVDYIQSCESIDERMRTVVTRRLNGDTLEAVGKDLDLTRERVRQLEKSGIQKAKSRYQADTGMRLFDEDYYRYFFETYAINKKDAEKWLGITPSVIHYLELTGSTSGSKDLQGSEDDNKNLDYGFRLKVRNYLNRNKLFLDGIWVEKKRGELEDYVVRKYCGDNVSFSEFCSIYNDFLRDNEVEDDESIYYTEDLERARKNKLSDSRIVLWKQNEQLRYYDIDSRDYTELWEELNLDAYENVEYSTLKFTTEHPGIMKKYDIRDHYELHNLMRKTIPSGSYHDFSCGKMPMVKFGKFDMESALFDLLIDNAPISLHDFADLVQQQYGYDTATVIGSYLHPLDIYYHQGIYNIDQKTLSSKHQKVLEEQLTDAFYYIDEIRNIYMSSVPDGDPESINPYTLKSMGFTVGSDFVFKGYKTLDDYFRELLTKEDVTDITAYRKRFVYSTAFSATIVNLKKERKILEFEPNQFIHIRKLNAAGVSIEDIQVFCDDVYDFVDKESYFSVKSIMQEGFTSELFDLGFSDWFYSNLVSSDERFSSSQMFGNIILFNGDKRITIKSFEEALIKEQESVDVYDLQNQMINTYGCRISDRSDLIYKIKGTEIYYDKYLDKLYANKGLYYRELDETEGL